MKSVVILLIAANLEFTINTPIQGYKITYDYNFNCFDKIDEIRKKIAIYQDAPVNRWVLKDGRQMIGGYCE